MARVGTLLASLLTFFLQLATSRASELKSDETVLFLSGVGSPESNGWRIDIRGWVYESEYHKPVTSLLRRALGIRDDELTAAELAIFRQRAQFFLVDNERHKRVVVRLGEMTLELSPSLPNGHFESSFHIPAIDLARAGLNPTNLVLPFQTIGGGKAFHTTTGELRFIPTNGISVISDVDDTIKISNVNNRHELLRNTFCRPYEAVPGMAEAYERWSKSDGVTFHYVSASPWQLFVPLEAFVRSNGFPAGTFSLKSFRWKDRTFFDLFKSPEQYKLSTIEPLMEQFPTRRFVLVGDSGEKDPEIYGTLARKHTNQIAQIFIRNVTPDKADSARYRSAFAGLSTNLWHVFTSPSELPDPLP
jgi:Phosphatidate phosphatase APP1, catalytic domain